MVKKLCFVIIWAIMAWSIEIDNKDSWITNYLLRLSVLERDYLFMGENGHSEWGGGLGVVFIRVAIGSKH